MTHVIMWLGGLASSPDGNPRIMDSHDNQPPVHDGNKTVIPAGVDIRPFIQGSWYHTSFDHAHRIIP